MVAILEHMSALSDPTRCRMLLLLERHELTVSELCAVLQMPQSSVSRHLKTLADDGWVASRRDGTSRFYSMPLDDLDAAAARLWPLIREQVAATNAAGQDERRLRGVLARRRAKSQEFFATRRRRLGPAAQRSVRRHILPLGRSRPDRPGAGRRRPRLRHRPAHRNHRAVRPAGHRRRQFGRHAGCGAAAAGCGRQRRPAAR